MKKQDILNIIKNSVEELKNPTVEKWRIDEVENLFNIAAGNPLGNEVHLYPHLIKGTNPNNPQTYISIQENLQRRTSFPTINYIKG